jgi:amino acid efflux transporter
MTELKQTIGFWQGVGLLATTLLGTGIFILPQVTVEMAGSNALFAWFFLAIAILPITVVFAELGKQLPHAAGLSFYIEKALGNVLGKTSGLLFILLIPVGAPAALDMVSQFLGSLVALTEQQRLFAELGFLAAIWLLNIRGIQASGMMQLGLTITMLLVIVAMLFAATDSADYQNAVVTTTPEWSPITQAMAIAFWSFLGIEAMTHLSSEFKNPQRDFLPAMIIGTLTVAAIYIVSTWLVLPMLGESQLLMIVAFDSLFGGYGGLVIGCLGIVSGFATVNVYSAGISRLTWSYANDGLLPQPLAKLNSHQVPVNSYTLILSMITLVVLIKHALSIPFENLILWANGVVILIYLFSMFAAFKLLKGAKKLWAILGGLVSSLIIYSIGVDMLYAILMCLAIGGYLKISGRAKLVLV